MDSVKMASTRHSFNNGKDKDLGDRFGALSQPAVDYRRGIHVWKSIKTADSNRNVIANVINAQFVCNFIGLIENIIADRARSR